VRGKQVFGEMGHRDACCGLHDLVLAIAATCRRSELAHIGGNAGEALFIRSRAAPLLANRKDASTKITLAAGKHRTFAHDDTQLTEDALTLTVD
jgi:hypothetical protein